MLASKLHFVYNRCGTKMCNETKENKALFTALPKVNLCKRVVITYTFLTPDVIRIKEVNISENNISP